MNTTTFGRAETLHRLIKQVMDSGAVSTLAEAEELFRGYRISFQIGPAEAHQADHQAALMTGVALARRVFLGGVAVVGALDVPLRVPLPLGGTLGSAIEALGGAIGQTGSDTPLVTIGKEPQPRAERFHIRTMYSGWRGGIVPAHSPLGITGSEAMPLAPMLAGALAVNEAFLHVNGRAPSAGRRLVGLSLWRPGNYVEWLAPSADEPDLHYLPTQLWLIGLGHLGQAFLWGLGLLRYPDPAALRLVLQDVDFITPSTESTSILADASMLGQRKTRAMAAWAACRGFSTAIYERLFDVSFRRQAEEPAIALCGIDNALGRRALDQVGFDFVVEAGLGRGHQNFRTLRLHILPGGRSAADIWKAASGHRDDVTDRAAYQKMLVDGDLDRCGVTLLAGKAVGAPFVGAVAACLGLAEVLRLLQGGPLHQLIDLDLQSLDHRTAVLHTMDFTSLNPGYVRVAA